MARRIAAFLYGATCYLMFLATAGVAYCFLGNLVFERTIDSPPTGPLGWALLVNTALLTVFALQHSVMARPAFKRWWTKLVPVPVERSTYVLFSNLAILLLCWQWQPIGGTVWTIEDPTARAAMLGVYTLGWAMVVGTTFAINHFDLFGLRQVTLYLLGKPYTQLPFRVPGPYKIVRHPLYVGWITLFWATPTMTVSHLLFAVATTAYILIAIQLEERDLEATFGNHYRAYTRNVPMLVPVRTPQGEPAESAA